MKDSKNKEAEGKMMKKFYDEISGKYDFIFPLNEIQKKFFDELLNENFYGRKKIKVLDAGASTGNLSKYLTEKNMHVVSIDINAKLIEKAREKGIDVKNINMLDIDRIDEKFDLIVNIGNTLPHLSDKEEVLEFFRKSFGKLEGNGKIVIQLINFNKFLLQKGEGNYLGQLPVIENSNVKFERRYYLTGDGNIEFRTVLDESVENSERLLNINYLEIKQLMEKSGFQNIEVFGGFSKEKFDYENSLFLVMTAKKPDGSPIKSKKEIEENEERGSN